MVHILFGLALQTGVQIPQQVELRGSTAVAFLRVLDLLTPTYTLLV
jgi:hypothetical protein